MGFILGAIIFGTIGVAASTLFRGSEISYDKTKTNLISDNVQDAIDEVYDKVIYGDADSNSILSGKKALVNGNKVTGAIETKSDSGNATLTPSTSVVSKSYPAGYYPNAHGAQVGAVSSITPSENGTAFSAGIVKMNSSGYAYTGNSNSKIYLYKDGEQYTSITGGWAGASESGWTKNHLGSSVTLKDGAINSDNMYMYTTANPSNSGVATKKPITFSKEYRYLHVEFTSTATASSYNNQNVWLKFPDKTSSEVTVVGGFLPCKKTVESTSTYPKNVATFTIPSDIDYTSFDLFFKTSQGAELTIHKVWLTKD